MGTPADNEDRLKKRRVIIAVVVSLVAVAAVGIGFRFMTGTADAVEPVPDPEFDTLAERGAWLFETRGCIACHGPDGEGGIENPNYVLGTVPALNEIADRLMLFDPADAQLAVDMLEQGVAPESRRGDPPFEGYERFLAQYEVVLGVIDHGAVAARADPEGPEPPRQMPAWGDILSDEDENAILAYLIGLYDWEGEDEVDEELDEGADPYADDDDEADPYGDDDDEADPYGDDDDEADPYADDDDEVNPYADDEAAPNSDEE